MALTRQYKETIQARIQRDPRFRHKVLCEGMECLLAGDIETGKAFLRDLIHATVGFARLAEATHHSTKSLMRM
ncbi:MAG: transcriptional regulator, partial [Acidobacteriota bacterium]